MNSAIMAIIVGAPVLLLVLFAWCVWDEIKRGNR